ncbi:MAG: NAD(P)H-dependent glycerol-3-phosphate dehydrogenase, partial [Bacteroidota bacterium]
NYTFGFQLGKGETFEVLAAEVAEMPEGVRTLQICEELTQTRHLDFPIIRVLYQLLFQQAEKRQLIDVILEK